MITSRHLGAPRLQILPEEGSRRALRDGAIADQLGNCPEIPPEPEVLVDDRAAPEALVGHDAMARTTTTTRNAR
jgi:hypothetical protein